VASEKAIEHGNAFHFVLLLTRHSQIVACVGEASSIIMDEKGQYEYSSGRHLTWSQPSRNFRLNKASCGTGIQGLPVLGLHGSGRDVPEFRGANLGLSRNRGRSSSKKRPRPNSLFSCPCLSHGLGTAWVTFRQLPTCTCPQSWSHWQGPAGHTSVPGLI
jgi:hypothetical protein